MTATCCDQPHLLPLTRRALVGKLHGTVIEIGPGDGSNLPHLSGDVRWIGIEPSSHNRRRLRQTAARLGQAIDLRDGVAEHLPMPDNSVDAVLGTLVLCSVTDPIRVLSEVRRVLRPAGLYVFEEHVAAPHGTWTLRYQHVIGLRSAIFGGCRPNRATHLDIAAAGFAAVESTSWSRPGPLGTTTSLVSGVATS
jgi:ubiquinone/menaquinone biosynthesis C-methylase UbiE